jgi:acyl-CoA reductase-like NAD-dependent aldehyde dehydrogenase/nicotinamidase-related amidase
MKPLLVLIDLQHDFLRGPGLEPAPGMVVERAARLLRKCREQGIPVIHVRTAVCRQSDDRLRHWRLAGRWICETGTHGYETPAELAALPDEPVIHKAAFSGFAGTRLAVELRTREVDTLIIAGVHLHACVRQTAIDAYQSGLDVWIADDAVASDDAVHAAITRRYLEARAIAFPRVEELVKILSAGEPPPMPPGDDDAIRLVVDLAANRQAAWQATTKDHRLGLVRDLVDRLAGDSMGLTRLIAREIGKPARFARVEVERTGEMLRAIMARATSLVAAVSDSVAVRRRPLGTVAIITPFNNPVYLPLGKIVPAILHGNTVVWKPAPEATLVSRRVMAFMKDAGWPEGLVSLLEGGRRQGQALLNDPRIDAVSLTGSSAAGFSAQEACARRRLPLQAELGGNNAAIVWNDADLVDAARQLAAGAFDMAGQRCTANRRVIVHRTIEKPFLELLLAESRALPWGDPRDEHTRIGPLVSVARRDSVAGMVDRAVRECGAPLLPQGRDLPTTGHATDVWYPPTILRCDDPGHEIVQEETFGPVLVLQTAGNWSEAIEACNGVRQGLAAAVFTRSQDVALRFLDEARAGILKLNRSTADAAVDVPFGGWKASGIGPPEHGEFDLDFFTRPQTVYGTPSELTKR